MDEPLRLYLGTHIGLLVVDCEAGRSSIVGRSFEGKSVAAVCTPSDDPNVILAGVAYDGAYRSLDGGERWERVIDEDVRAFSVDPHDQQTIYAGAGPIRLHRSTDQGQSWRAIDQLLEMPEQVTAKWTVPARHVGHIPPHVCNIFVHPDDAALLFLTLEHGGVVRSRDAGASWDDVSDGLAYPDMHMLANYPGSRDCYFVSSARGFFVTDDRGEGWRRSEDGMPWAYTEVDSYSHDFLFLPGSPPRMLLAGSRGSPGFWGRPSGPEGVLLISDDLGDHWHVTTRGLPESTNWFAHALTHHPADADTVFAGIGDESQAFGFTPGVPGSGAVYVSEDRGESWQPLVTDLPSVTVLEATVRPGANGRG